MFSQTVNETHQSKSNVNLNKFQITLIESVIKFSLDDITQTFIAKPEFAIKALTAILNGVEEKDKESLNSVLDSIEVVRKLITHNFPQNRHESKFKESDGYCPYRLDLNCIKTINGQPFDYFLEGFNQGKYRDGIVPTIILKNGRIIPQENFIYFECNGNILISILLKEEKGLLSLTSREDNSTPPVTKDDVVSYINQRIQTIIEQFISLQNLPKLQKFIKSNEEKIQALLRDCDTLTFDQFVKMEKKELNKLLGNSMAIARLLDKVHMPLQEILNMEEAIRLECIKHAIRFVQLTEVGISWNEILSLPEHKRFLFYKHSEKIATLIKGNKTNFDSLKENINDLDFNDQNKSVKNVVTAASTLSKPIREIVTPSITSNETTQSTLAIHQQLSENHEVNNSTSAIRHSRHYQQNNNSGLGFAYNTTSVISFSNRSRSTGNPHFNFFEHTNHLIDRISPLNVLRPENLWWVRNRTALALPNGNIILSANGDVYNTNLVAGPIQILKPNTGEIVSSINTQGRILRVLALLPNNQLAGCNCHSQSIYIYDLTSGQITQTISHQHAAVTQLVSIDNNLILFTKGNPPKLSIYNITTGELVNTIYSGFSQNECMLLTENKVFLVGFDHRYNHFCQLICLSTGEMLREIPLKRGDIPVITLLPNGNLAVSADSDNIDIYNFDASNDNVHVLQIKTPGTNAHQSLSVSENGHLILGDSAGNVQEFDYITGECLQAFKCEPGTFIASKLALEMLFKQLSASEPNVEVRNRMIV